MNTKHLGKWIIVLLLLAALPGMTAAVAQGQTPPEKHLPVVTEVGSTTSHTYSYWESEPNNTMDQAQYIQYRDVVGATFNPRTSDVDYFKFNVGMYPMKVLIDTDNGGSEADTVVRLFKANGTEVGYNDDAPYPDSLLYRVLTDGWYYIKVTNYQSNTCEDCSYMVSLTSPLLISAHAANLGAASVEGIPFEARDILAFSSLRADHNGNAQHKWIMFLDSSDVGFSKQLVNLSTGFVNPSGVSGSVAVTFAANQTLVDYAGVTRIAKPWDWVSFDLSQVGTNSAITAIQVIPGTRHGLSTASEKPDAFILEDEVYLDEDAEIELLQAWFSTVGAGAVPQRGGGTLRFADEDLFISEFGNDGQWRNYLESDGSLVTGMANEDIVAADYHRLYGMYYLTIQGNGTILNHPVSQKDIFTIDYNYNWWGSTFWHGPDYGWNYNIDAFDVSDW